MFKIGQQVVVSEGDYKIEGRVAGLDDEGYVFIRMAGSSSVIRVREARVSPAN